MRIWFHGTNEEAAKLISNVGFAPGTYFAKHLEDALEFGGPYVFMVALDYEPAIDGNWQMRVGQEVPSGSIVRLTRYKQKVIEDFPDRMQSVFEANEE